MLVIFIIVIIIGIQNYGSVLMERLTGTPKSSRRTAGLNQIRDHLGTLETGGDLGVQSASVQAIRRREPALAALLESSPEPRLGELPWSGGPHLLPRCGPDPDFGLATLKKNWMYIRLAQRNGGRFVT
jgi:hypothetical protein